MITAPRIAHGPRAGQPRPLGDVLLDRVTNVRDILIKLRAAGYEPVRVDIDGARPTIELQPHRDLATLATEGVACYYAQRPGQRIGQWIYSGCRIVWMEDLH